MTMAVLLHLLLLLFIGCTTVHGAWEDGNKGVDRPGGELPGMPITLNDSRPQECAKLCQKTDKCKAWSYSQPYCGSRNFTQPPWCYLKGTVTRQRLDPCRVRAVLYGDYYIVLASCV